jgi:hypothetical protein
MQLRGTNKPITFMLRAWTMAASVDAAEIYFPVFDSRF